MGQRVKAKASPGFTLIVSEDDSEADHSHWSHNFDRDKLKTVEILILRLRWTVIFHLLGVYVSVCLEFPTEKAFKEEQICANWNFKNTFKAPVRNSLIDVKKIILSFLTLNSVTHCRYLMCQSVKRKKLFVCCQSSDPSPTPSQWAQALKFTVTGALTFVK